MNSWSGPKKRRLELELDYENRQKKIEKMVADQKAREKELADMMKKQIATQESIGLEIKSESIWRPSDPFSEETLVEAGQRRIDECGSDKRRLEKTVEKIAEEVNPKVKKLAQSEFLINAIMTKGFLTRNNGYVACKFFLRRSRLHSALLRN